MFDRHDSLDIDYYGRWAWHLNVHTVQIICDHNGPVERIKRTLSLSVECLQQNYVITNQPLGSVTVLSSSISSQGGAEHVRAVCQSTPRDFWCTKDSPFLSLIFTIASSPCIRAASFAWLHNAQNWLMPLIKDVKLFWWAQGAYDLCHDIFMLHLASLVNYSYAIWEQITSCTRLLEKIRRDEVRIQLTWSSLAKKT